MVLDLDSTQRFEGVCESAKMLVFVFNNTGNIGGGIKISRK